MKMQIVVKVSSMNDDKSRSKALKISVCISGVESAALKGDEVLVVGEGIDAVRLIRQLRKSMSHAELVSVSKVKKAVEPQNCEFSKIVRNPSLEFVSKLIIQIF